MGLSLALGVRVFEGLVEDPPFIETFKQTWPGRLRKECSLRSFGHSSHSSQLRTPEYLQSDAGSAVRMGCQN